MEALKKAIGNRIRSSRKAKGMSQQDFAFSVGRATSAISNIERGLSFPSIETLRKSADVLGCELRDFFEGIEASSAKSADRLRLEGEMWGLLFLMSDKELAAVIKAAKAIVSVREQ